MIMKKWINRLFLATALTVAVPTLTSCDKVAEAIGNSYDFCEACDCFQEYADRYNSKAHAYEKDFDNETDAYDTAKRYTNNKMTIPGTWDYDTDEIIQIERGTGNIYYVIYVDSKYKDKHYTTHFRKR